MKANYQPMEDAHAEVLSAREAYDKTKATLASATEANDGARERLKKASCLWQEECDRIAPPVLDISAE